MTDNQRRFRFKNAEEALERQRQDMDRSQLDLKSQTDGWQNNSVTHLPVELHQDIAKWFRNLGTSHIPAPKTPELRSASRSTRPAAVVLDREIVDWFAAHGEDVDGQISLVLQEFIRSVDAVESSEGLSPQRSGDE